MNKNHIVVGIVVLGVIAVAWLKSGGPANADKTTEKLPRLVELGAGICDACKKMAPIIEELKEEYAGRIAVESIDVKEEPNRAQPFDWRLIPLQVFLDADGKELWRNEGPLTKEQIVAKFKELGMI